MVGAMSVHITFNGLVNILDTVKSCREAGKPWSYYCHGDFEPNYAVPAIPLACAIHRSVVQIAECDWFEGELFFNLVAEFDRE